MTVRDPEILLELRDEPELLAVADGLAEALAAHPVAEGRSRRARSWRPLALGVAAAGAVAAAAVLAVVLTGNAVDRPLVDRALAAIGDQPVLHAVLRQEDQPDTTLVQLSTGRHIAHPRVTETEIWFDKARALEHTITRSTGRPAEDMLATPQGILSESGPVWTCARIAAHPIEATRAHVSCNFSGVNGTKPRHVPEPPPTLDPALAGFVDGYRRALAGGAVRKVGEGVVDGHHVFWLEFRLADEGPPPVVHRSERVAVSTDTYRPMLVRPVWNGDAGLPYTVTEIETVSRAEANFERPKLLPAEERPTSSNARLTGELTFDQASKELGTRVLWAGTAVGGLRLAAVERKELITGFPRGSGVPARVTPVVSLVYGGIKRRNPTFGSVEIVESATPVAEWSLSPPPTPPPGFLRFDRPGSGGFMRVGGLYVQIAPFPPLSRDEALVLAVARALESAPAGR